jgi:hypothetical protein
MLGMLKSMNLVMFYHNPKNSLDASMGENPGDNNSGPTRQKKSPLTSQSMETNVRV